MGLTLYSANKLLKAIFQPLTWTAPTDVYISLHTAEPQTPLGLSYEVVDDTYSRLEVTGLFDVASRAAENNTDLDFGDFTALQVVTHWGIYDDPTTGNLLFWGKFTFQRTFEPGTPALIPEDAIHVTA